MLVEFLLGTPRGAPLERALRGDPVDLHVPALCDVEVTAVLRRAVLRRRLGVERALDALEDYLDLPLARHGHTYLLDRMMGMRRNFSAYDATYLALAEWLQASFLTADQKLRRAARAHLEIAVV